MCTGVEIALIVAAAAGGTAAVAQGRAQQKANKRAAERDGLLAEQAQTIARQKAERERRRALILLGNQRARQAASGGTFEGTFLDLTAETAENLEMSALNIEFGGEQESTSLLAGAQAKKFAGLQAKKAGEAQAIQTVLSTGGQIGQGRSATSGTAKTTASGPQVAEAGSG